MTFLTPWFLLGLAALAVPVLIHLTQRERKAVIVFPSLMFLRKIPYESVHRRRIRDWLLLAVRLAALALIVAAFSRPFVRGAELAAAGGGAREVVVLLDRSYSMGATDVWTRAQQLARQAVGTVAGSDRVSLVLFDGNAELVLRSSPDASRVIAGIDAATPGAGATNFVPALKLAASILAESDLPRREVALVSDFQRAGWQPNETLRLPAGAVLTAMPVEASTARNLSVTPLVVQRAPVDGQERVVITAGVNSRVGPPGAAVQVRLELDGRTVQTSSVDVAAGGSASTTFAPVAIPAQTRVAVRIPDDGVATDNAFYSVVSPPQPLPVVVVPASGRGPDGDLYLLRALAIGDAPRFRATTHAIDAADLLRQARVAIVQDAPISDAVAAQLRTFVEGGNGLVLALGPRSTWPAQATWLPLTLTGVADRTRGVAAKLSGVDYGHAVFEAFRAPRSGDFSSTRFYGYRTLTTTAQASTLARFDAGEPALVDIAVGRGRVLVWASSLDLSWSDLALKPVYLPFVHQLVRHAAGYRPQPPWMTVGQVLDPSAGSAGPLPMVVSPSGARIAPTPEQPAVELAEAGFYEMRPADAGRTSGAGAIVASNVNLGESDPTRMEAAELVTALAGAAGTAGQDGGPIVVPDQVQEQSQRVWWYLLFAGILLLITESVLAQRLPRVAR